MKILLWPVVVIAALALLALIGGRLGWMSGRAPEGLGVRDGKLKPPARTPNSVSSQAQLWRGTDALVDSAQIEPLPLAGGAAGAIDKLRTIVAAMPGARIVTVRDDYLYAQFTTPTLRFVDDVEFYAVPADNVVHVRSASRVGRRDFGVNRARIETIRAAYGAR